MKKPRFILYYSLLKTYLAFTLQQFYRRVEIAGYHEHVPREVPVVFAPNHSNAFIDALNVAGFTAKDKQPTFVTRSDVFVKWALPAMTALKMLPIYRERDGVDAMRKNEAIFAKLVELLTFRDSIIIFPEGNHGRTRRLRPLKKGIARMCFQAAEQNGFDLPTQIVPVGLNYSDHVKFYRDLLVVYGPPIDVQAYYDLYRSDANKALIALRDAVYEGLRDCLIDIPTKEYYDMVEALREILSVEMTRAQGGDVNKGYDRFRAEKALIAMLQARIDAGDAAIPALDAQVRDYRRGLAVLKLRDHVLRDAPHAPGRLLGQGLLFALGLPLFLYGAVNHYHIYRFFHWLAVSKFRDDHFHSSMMHVQGFFLLPLLYLLQTGLVWALSNGWFALAYLLSLLPAGNLAVAYRDAFKRWWGRLRYNRLLLRGDETLKRLVEWRKDFAALVGQTVKAG
ncbi:MAG: hypothetical protein OHK0039_28010 [Bacteroidia bacterium]